MPTIRERLANFFLGDQRQKLERLVQDMYHAYLAGPYQLTPDELLSQLKEYDSALIYDLVTQLSYENLGAYGYGVLSDTSERIRLIQESRRLYKYDVMYQWQIWLWTNFVFSESVKVAPNDPAGQEIWSEFWDADRNQPILADDNIQRMSEDLLVDGNLFLSYYISQLDGETTVSIIDPLEITDVVYGSGYQPLFYKRSFILNGRQENWYYPSWQLLVEPNLINTVANPPRDAERADKIASANNTVVYLQHIAHNCKSRYSAFGYPLGTAGFPWIRAHKRFREDRATVASTVAMYVNKLKVKGGSRAIDALRSQIQTTLSATNYKETNPPAVAGSTWLENDAAELSRLPLNTGGSDAKTDGDALLLMAGLGGGVYPHWLGAGDAYRLATATAMEAPMQRQFNRYQRFWASQFRKMVRIVLTAKNFYGGAVIQDMTADVSIDSLIKEDLQSISNSISVMLRDGLQPYLEQGIITPETAKPILSALWKVILQALDIDNADEIANDETFGVQPSESADEVTGKFKPDMPSAFPQYADDPNDLVVMEDVQEAIRAWRSQTPDDFAGILDAKVE